MHRAYTECAQAVHRFGICAVLILAGCGADAPVSGDVTIPVRNPTAPIGVTSRYDDARFAGLWHVRGAYPRDADLVTVERVPEGPAWAFVMRACDAQGACQSLRTTWPARGDQPGADVVADPAGGPVRRPVVVWVDEGFRTAAVGDAEGRFAWVLDRAPQGGADRIRAARQVLEFSGFDLRDMQMRPG
ncbi:lipocalin [Tateyamaria sp. SN6-1]|uniref:lipocalin n=1 Tax=Tateyamaria sp. SN6-1 TaxID=3092148 RepID=UPI0039F49286